MVTNNPRMSVEHNGHNSWTLNLEDVQRNDSGSYMCQINTEPMTSQVSKHNNPIFLKLIVVSSLHKLKVIDRYFFTRLKNSDYKFIILFSITHA